MMWQNNFRAIVKAMEERIMKQEHVPAVNERFKFKQLGDK